MNQKSRCLHILPSDSASREGLGAYEKTLPGGLAGSLEINGSPGRTRTYNSAVNSRVLYH